MSHFAKSLQADFDRMDAEKAVAAAKEACERDAARQADDLALMRQALAALETVEYTFGSWGGACAWCHHDDHRPHADDCPRQAAIAALRKRLERQP
jgi:cytochrome c553